MSINNENIKEFELNDEAMEEVVGGATSNNYFYPTVCPMELNYTYFKRQKDGTITKIGSYRGKYINRKMQDGTAFYLFMTNGKPVWIPQNCIWE